MSEKSNVVLPQDQQNAVLTLQKAFLEARIAGYEAQEKLQKSVDALQRYIQTLPKLNNVEGNFNFNLELMTLEPVVEAEMRI